MIDDIKKIIASALDSEIPFNVSVSEKPEFGDYTTNVAFDLAKIRRQSPMAVAEMLLEKIKDADKDGLLAKVAVAAPGFINFWVTNASLEKSFKNYQSRRSIGAGQTVIIDYCGTNIAKPMHFGHLRSTIIGDAMARIHNYLGYRVIRWNYLGDWGTQFGKLIVAYKLWGDKAIVESAPIKELLALYVRFHNELKTNPELEGQGQVEFKKLENGDAENRQLWEWFRKESLLVFEKTYKRLGVVFDVSIGESFYEKDLSRVIDELKKGGLAISSQGGLIVDLVKFNLPVALVQKSDGASLYITRDIASLKHRLDQYNPQKILYVVGNEQTLHFSQLFAIARLIGFTKVELQHLKFGLVLGDDGKKLATREGKVVQLEDVINEIVARAFTVVSEKNPDLSETERRMIAEIVGIGALKYNDLMENRTSNILFNWKQMLDFNGNSAPYLQYTAVRLLNIIRKAKNDPDITGDLADVSDAMKPLLIKKIIEFNNVVSLSAETYLTNYLAKYLFELAKLANQYYETVRILDDSNSNKKQQSGRLLLIGAIVQRIKDGLNLLGISVPERI